jgi:hypothetical protein
MNNKALAATLRYLSHAVIAIMAAVLLYAGYISLANWSGIAV